MWCFYSTPGAIELAASLESAPLATWWNVKTMLLMCLTSVGTRSRQARVPEWMFHKIDSSSF